MIKVIFFDLGSTHMKGSAPAFVKKSCKILKISYSKFLVSNVIFDPAFNKGKIGVREFFNRYFSIPISKKQMKQLIEKWKNTWKPEAEMRTLVRRLEKNYRLGMISNSDPVNAPNYAKKGWLKPFEFLALSHELGILKPNPAIYKIALKKMKVPAKECLFIDDQKICLKPARKLGMKTIWFRSLKQLKKELTKTGINY